MKKYIRYSLVIIELCTLLTPSNSFCGRKACQRKTKQAQTTTLPVPAAADGITRYAAAAQRYVLSRCTINNALKVGLFAATITALNSLPGADAYRPTTLDGVGLEACTCDIAVLLALFDRGWQVRKNLETMSGGSAALASGPSFEALSSLQDGLIKISRVCLETESECKFRALKEHGMLSR